MKSNDGGPAFPKIVEDIGGTVQSVGGMSLRDWFAGNEPIGDAMDGLSIATLEILTGLTRPDGRWDSNPIGWFEFHAAAESRIKYIRADAMLAERSKQ